MITANEAFAHAVGDHHAGRLATAELMYRHVLSEEPEHVAARFLLGTLCLQQGQARAAIPHLAKAIRLDREMPDFHAALGEASRQLGEIEAAFAGAKRCLALAPSVPLRLAQYGQLQQQDGRAQDAAVSFRRATAPDRDCPDIHDALGTVERSLGRTGQAVGAYRRAVALAPGQAPLLSNLGAAEEPEAGLGRSLLWYRRGLAVHAESAALYNNLGNALRGLDRLGHALTAYRSALALAPGYALAVSNLSAAERQACRFETALLHGERALAIAPLEPGVSANHGLCLVALHWTESAATAFRRTIALAPAHAMAIGQLGNCLQEGRGVEAAGSTYARMLALDPGDPDAHMALSYIARLGGDLAAERAHKWAAFARKRLYSEYCTSGAEAPRILLLLAPEHANVPYGALLTADTFTLHKLLVIAEGKGAPVARLPGFDVVFNGIGEADAARDTLILASEFLRERGLTALNDPRIVAVTNRDRMAGLIARIPGAIAPSTTPAARAALTPDRLGATLAEGGLEYPVLIRPFGAHGGADLAKIEDEREIEGFLARTPGEDFYLTQFLDFRSADGFYRKYRVVFIEGRPFAYHLAIHDDWKVHYFRAAMQANPWMLEEEHRFMADWTAVFGPIATAACGSIAATLPLEYFGIDCTLAADGRLIVFEANASMLVHLYDSVDEHPYKHVYVPRIVDAFRQMIERRVSQVPR